MGSFTPAPRPPSMGASTTPSSTNTSSAAMPGPAWGTGGGLDAFGGGGRSIAPTPMSNPSWGSGGSLDAFSHITPSFTPPPSKPTSLLGPGLSTNRPSVFAAPATPAYQPATRPAAAPPPSSSMMGDKTRQKTAANPTLSNAAQQTPRAKPVPTLAGLKATATKVRDETKPMAGQSNAIQSAKALQRRDADKRLQAAAKVPAAAAAKPPQRIDPFADPTGMTQKVGRDMAKSGVAKTPVTKPTLSHKDAPINQFVYKAMADQKALKARQAVQAQKQAQAVTIKQAAAQARAALPGVSADAHATNARAVQWLRGSARSERHASFQSDALNNYGDQALAEYHNFMGQLHADDPDRVAVYHAEVVKGLTPEAQASLSQYDITPATAARDAMGGMDDAGYDEGKVLLDKLHAGTGAEDILARAQSTLATDPKAFEKLPDEVKSFYKAYQEHYHGELGYQANPSPDWERTRHRNAVIAGTNAASAHYSGQGMVQPTEKAMQTLDQVTGKLMRGEPVDLQKFEATIADIEGKIPPAYRNTRSTSLDHTIGETAHEAMGLIPGIGAGMDAGVNAGDMARELAKSGLPPKIQRAAATAIALTTIASGPLGKVSNKALSSAMRQHVSKELAHFSARDGMAIVEHLMAKGFEIGGKEIVNSLTPAQTKRR